MDDTLGDRIGNMLESVALIALIHVFLSCVVPVGTQGGKHQRGDDIKGQKGVE